MTLSAAERERRALIWANRPPPRTDAERARAYRDRLRAIRDAPEIEAARIATIHRRQELAIIAERNRITQEIERREREAKELATRQAAEVARRAETGPCTPLAVPGWPTRHEPEI